MNYPFENATFIWLNHEKYPNYQKSNLTVMQPKEPFNFCIAQFKKNIYISKPIKSAKIYIFADCFYRLSINAAFVGVGPACAGGDFSNTNSLPDCYYHSHELELVIGDNTLLAEVQLTPNVLIQTSKGHGGLIASIVIEYEDGEIQIINTDTTWLSRQDTTTEKIDRFSYKNNDTPWDNVVETENIWGVLLPSPIKSLKDELILTEQFIIPDYYKDRCIINNSKITFKYGEPLSFTVAFDKIYSGYPCFKASSGKHLLKFNCSEFLGEIPSEMKTIARIDANEDYSFRGWRLQSIGYMQFTLTFFDKSDVEISDIGLYYSHYNENETEGSFKCSDQALNDIYDLCKHTLKICRNSLSLDSPYHQETLACTGDYFIEALMAYMTLGDTKLSAFDIKRTLDFLDFNNGFMFHTTYSLILLEMITDYYQFSGDKALLKYAAKAMHKLLKLFHSYTDESGIVTYAPNYMFVDHLHVEGFEMHHPPRELGETVLNAYYYNALLHAKQICDLIGDEMGREYLARAEKLKTGFNKVFWDETAQLYIDGRTYEDVIRNDKKAECTFDDWTLPKSPNKIYHTKYPNTLAVLYDLASSEKKTAIMEKIMTDKTMIGCQPYFMHFVLEALTKTGLFEKYGLEEIRKWHTLFEECNRGLKEIWIGFDCDYSHAWGGTPAYQLPYKISGLKILEPGYKRIILSPELYGLEWADIEIPTPFGNIVMHLKEDGKHDIYVPKEIDASII